MVLGTTLGRPQANSWTLGRVHNIINKGDGRFLAKIHVAVDGQERYAGQINSPPEFSILTYDTTSKAVLAITPPDTVLFPLVAHTSPLHFWKPQFAWCCE